MQGSRFDTFTRWTAVTQAGAGVAAAVGLASLGSHPAVAQVATPVPEASPAASVPVSLLFVQYAGVTTLTPGAGDVHTLTMTEVRPQTIYFSDRPNRIAGAEPTASFVDSFTTMFADSAPNASLIGHLESGGHQEEAVVLTLLSAAYDVAAATLTYEVTLLDAELITDVAFENEPLTVFDAPREYAEVSLFIDSVDNQFFTNCTARGDGCDLPSCCETRCAEVGGTVVDSWATICAPNATPGASVMIYNCICGFAPDPTPTPAPAPDDTGECDPWDCNGPSWDCVCDGSISMACADGVWDTEPGTDCCPASCKVNGWEATEPGVFIPEKECCTEAG